MKRLVALAAVALLGTGLSAQDAKPQGESLQAKLIRAINEGKLTGKSAATEDGFTRDGEKLDWLDVSADELVRMYLAIDLRDEDLITLAQYAKRAGLRLEAERALSRYLTGGDRKERQPRIDRIVAAWRSRGVPEGGYAFDPTYGWESANDRANRQVLSKVAGLSATIAAASDPKAIEKAFADVLVLYKEAETDAELRASIRIEAATALRAAKDKRLKSIESKAKSSSKNFAALSQARQELQKRRADALKLIYDAAIYLPENHPDWRKGDKVNGQDKVDEKVLKTSPGSVEELWEHGGAYVARLDAGLQRDVALVGEINSRWLPEIGEKPADGELKAFEQILNNMHKTIDLKSFAADAKERDLHDYNRKVEAYNEALVDPAVTKDIKDHVKILNDYREMMGRKRLFIDARLCRATTKHSQACDAANRIWHEGPDGTPQSRARAEGFPDGVGENVAIGYANPADIWWRGWYRASDHHRNGLSDRWTCVGYGFVGRVGTQNFSDTALPKGFPAGK